MSAHYEYAMALKRDRYRQMMSDNFILVSLDFLYNAKTIKILVDDFE